MSELVVDEDDEQEDESALVDDVSEVDVTVSLEQLEDELELEGGVQQKSL